MWIPLVVALTSGAVSSSPALDGAQQAYADVDYPRCRDKAQSALLVPGSRADRVQAYKLLGLCAAAVGDTDAARDAFRVMLTIDRDARLPDGLSPRFTSSFREAKGSLVGTVPLALVVGKDAVDVDRRVVTLRLDDADALVDKITWRSSGGETNAPVKAAPTLELELPLDVDVDVLGLDATGGELIVVPLTGKARVRDSALDDKTVVPEDEGSALPYVVLGGVVGGVVLVGAAAGLAAVLLSPPQQVVLATDVAFAD